MGPEDRHNSVIYSANIYLTLGEPEKSLTLKTQGQTDWSRSLSASQVAEGGRFW